MRGDTDGEYEDEGYATDGEATPIGDRLRVLGGAFEPLTSEPVAGSAMVLSVLGQNIRQRGQPLLARVGQQPVLEVVMSPGGRGFSGLLAAVPNDGDRLFVRYAGYPEVQTDVVYRGPRRGGGRPMV